MAGNRTNFCDRLLYCTSDVPNTFGLRYDIDNARSVPAYMFMNNNSDWTMKHGQINWANASVLSHFGIERPATAAVDDIITTLLNLQLNRMLKLTRRLQTLGNCLSELYLVMTTLTPRDPSVAQAAADALREAYIKLNTLFGSVCSIETMKLHYSGTNLNDARSKSLELIDRKADRMYDGRELRSAIDESSTKHFVDDVYRFNAFVTKWENVPPDSEMMQMNWLNWALCFHFGIRGAYSKRIDIVADLVGNTTAHPAVPLVDNLSSAFDRACSLFENGATRSALTTIISVNTAISKVKSIINVLLPAITDC